MIMFDPKLWKLDLNVEPFLAFRELFPFLVFETALGSNAVFNHNAAMLIFGAGQAYNSLFIAEIIISKKKSDSTRNKKNCRM